jgi:hypothetical protein
MNAISTCRVRAEPGGTWVVAHVGLHTLGWPAPDYEST